MAGESSDWIVRDAAPDLDAPPCLEIYAPFVRDSFVSFEEAVPSIEDFRERIRATQLTHPWLVLEDRGVVAGYAYGSQHRTRAAYRWAADVSVYVAASHRRSGAGRRLYAELFERLRRQRFRIACAGATLPNDASVGLHEFMGFERVGVYKRVGWKAGSWRDVIWWQLELLPPTDDQPPEPLSPTEAGFGPDVRPRP